MEPTASENVVFHRMDWAVRKNATAFSKTVTTLKDVCFRQKVNNESKSICYVSHWKNHYDVIINFKGFFSVLYGFKGVI